MSHRAGIRKEDAWSQTSPQLFQQKTENTEKVSEIVAEKMDVDWVNFSSFIRMSRIFAYCLRLRSKVKGEVSMTNELQKLI